MSWLDESCPSCGCTTVRLEIAWQEPVQLDGEFLATGQVIDGSCKECGAPFDISQLTGNISMTGEVDG